jgi:hypothetical protein
VLEGLTCVAISAAASSPGGGHGVSGAFNLATIELYAKPVPR